MNYGVIILILVVGIAIGYYLRSQSMRSEADPFNLQSEQKEENLSQVLDYMQGRERTTNNDIEQLLNVSDATAERYLDELEKLGKLVQHGETGKSVFYTINN